MKLRQEPLVFCVSALALGFMGVRLFERGATTLRGGDRPTAAAEREHARVPDPAVAAPNAARPPLERELFLPPRDTAPLPPLELVEPPRDRLALLLPPTDPGPAPAAYGKLLRRALAPVDLPDLFVERADPEAALEDEAFFGLAEAERTPGGAKKDADPLDELTPSERAELIAGYKQRFDWIQRGPGELWFGRIVNPERYGLELDPARAGEALQFVRLDPATGRETYANIGAPPLAVERAGITSFGLAETVANEIELRARKIGTSLTRGTYDESLLLATYCIRKRLEAPRALVIAEELYRRAAAYDPKDPLPRLGLGRCLEAAFRFEDAFGVYQELLAAFPHREEVHVALAELEERFLMHVQAERRMREALAMNQGSWISRFALGRFLIDHGGASGRGVPSEAVQHLKVANQGAPQAPELLPVRVAIRTTLGDAHFALGELAEAEAAYRSAVQADAKHQRAQAGLLSTQVLAGKPPAAADAAVVEDAGFELLLARGVAALAAGRHEAARDALRLAVEADPLRAHGALAALSVVAEVTGNVEEAMRLADEALERDPTQAFALFQKGRLLGLADDYEGARAALLAALEQELDFEDALGALGDMAFRLGRFEDAERYLERAVAIAGTRAEVHALRGLNLLRLGSVAQAKAAFERALELAQGDPTGTAGLAWCLYLEGDPEEALIRLADISERRRNLPKEDPWRVWADAQIARLQEHLQKVEWRDPFSRKRLANGWLSNESDGPTVSMADGMVEISGMFERSGKGRVYRQYDGGDFVSFEADVWIEASKANASIGVFAARESARRDGVDVLAEASVSRHKEGGVQLRFVRKGQLPEERDMQQPFPTGKWVRVKLERRGESAEGTITMFLDGIALVENQPMPALAQSKSPLLVGLFVEGDTGRDVTVRMDNVSVVTRMQ